MENVEKLTQSATTETEVGYDGERSWRRLRQNLASTVTKFCKDGDQPFRQWKISAKCDVEKEFESVGKLSQLASTETEVGEDGDKSWRET